MTVLSVLKKLRNNSTFAAITGVVVGALLTEFLPKAKLAVEDRFIEPKKRHRQVLREQVAWLEERAEKLNVLAVQLRREPEADKIRLAFLISKLDRWDAQWAMKYSDVNDLLAFADQKNKECLDNAAETERSAEEVARMRWWDY
jgi:hypothetical protein